MPQTSHTAAPVRAYAGLVDGAGNEDIISAIVDQSVGIAPGLLVLRTTGGDYAGATIPTTAIAADDDAILLAFATAASTQTIDTEADGVVALARISPPRKITITRSSHANQDAVTAVLTGLDENGQVVTENFAFADGGGDSFTSTNRYSYFTSLVIPAQGGTAGTTKIGLAADATVNGGDVLGVSVHTHKAIATAPSSSNNEVHEDEATFPVIRKGRIWVKSETTFRAGDMPYVRLIAAGSEVYGAFRAEGTDSGDAWPLTKARFLSSGAANEFGLLEVNFT